MRKLSNIIKEKAKKRVAKKLSMELKKQMINEFESYIFNQEMITGKDRKTIIQEVLEKVQ